MPWFQSWVSNADSYRYVEGGAEIDLDAIKGRKAGKAEESKRIWDEVGLCTLESS
jgi:hypothetical protein